MTTEMNPDTIITVPCNDAHCASFGHEVYWSPTDDWGLIHQARSWEGAYYLIILERLDGDEPWVVNLDMDKAVAGFRTVEEIEQFVTDLRAAAALLAEVSAS